MEKNFFVLFSCENRAYDYFSFSSSVLEFSADSTTDSAAADVELAVDHLADAVSGT